MNTALWFRQSLPNFAKLRQSSHEGAHASGKFPETCSITTVMTILCQGLGDLNNFQGFAKGWFPEGWFLKDVLGPQSRNEGTTLKAVIVL